jgi:LuxR family maltose regulon positive regulatory protein
MRRSSPSGAAQVWLAYGRASSDRAAVDRALDLVREQRLAADTLGLGWLRMKLTALEALGHEALGDRAQALALLQVAMELAEPEGCVRLFADEGAPMAALLTNLRLARIRRGATKDAFPAYLDRLIAASSGSVPAASDGRRAASAEPLSGREMEVLGLIAAGRSNTQIAQALVVADSTVKTHTNNIFGKLGVNRRTHAVARARDLGRLP